MPSLKKIIKNIDSYTPEQLAAFVLAGDCTVYELNKTGYISPLTKRRIESIIADGGVSDISQPAQDTDSEPRTTLVDVNAMPQSRPEPMTPRPASSPRPAGMPPPPSDPGHHDPAGYRAGQIIEPVSLFD